MFVEEERRGGGAEVEVGYGGASCDSDSHQTPPPRLAAVRARLPAAAVCKKLNSKRSGVLTFAVQNMATVPGRLFHYVPVLPSRPSFPSSSQSPRLAGLLFLKANRKHSRPEESHRPICARRRSPRATVTRFCATGAEVTWFWQVAAVGRTELNRGQVTAPSSLPWQKHGGAEGGGGEGAKIRWPALVSFFLSLTRI